MSITLADINQQLKQQTEVLTDQKESLTSVSESISDVSSGLKSFLDSLRSEKFDKLEDERESKAQTQKESVRETRAPDIKKPSGLFDFGDLLGGALSVAGGIELVKAFGTALLRRGIPALLVNLFADEIADFIERETKSKEFADAIFRGMKLGSLGLLLGKKYGVLGFIAGVFLTPENQKALEDLGDTISNLEFRSKIEEIFGITIPTITSIFNKISDSFTRTIETINKALKGDLKIWSSDDEVTLINSLDEMLITAGALFALFRPKGLILGAIRTITKALGAAKNAILPAAIATSAAVAAPAAGALTAGELADLNREQAQNLKKNQLNKLRAQGFDVNKSGNIYNTSSGQVLSAEKAREALKGVGVSPVAAASAKYPRYAQALRSAKGIGALGALLSAFDIASVLMSPGSDEDKITAIGASLGGLSGATLGALFGTIIGGPLIGGIGGSLLLGLAGDKIGRAIGEYITNKPITSLGMFNDWANNLINNSNNSSNAVSTPSTSPLSMNMIGSPRIEKSATMSRPSTSGLGQIIADFNRSSNQNQQPLILQDNSSTVTAGGTTHQSMVAPLAWPFDSRDPMMGYS